MRTGWHAIAGLALLLAVAGCTASEPVATAPAAVSSVTSSGPTPPPLLPPARTPSAPTPSPGTSTPVAGGVESPIASPEEIREFALSKLGVAAYAPFNVDGQQGVGPWLFGPTPTEQQAGMDCYRQELERLVDTSLVEQRLTQGRSGFELLAEEQRGARQAVANCLAAEQYRSHWIANQVGGWNLYGRNSETQPELSPDDPCFAAIFATSEEFVAALVAESYFVSLPGQEFFIGPFDCAAAITGAFPTTEPTPPSDPWHQCEVPQFPVGTFDYRVVGITAADPDGGLVAHISPGIDAEITEVLAAGTGELQAAGCQRNATSGNVWWLVVDRGWVNSQYLEAHVPLAGNDWRPGLAGPIDSAIFDQLVGYETATMDDVVSRIRDEFVVESFTTVELTDFVGVDTHGGIARIDILGLADDSVGGYRLAVSIDLIRDDAGTHVVRVRVVQVTAWAICTRGVSGDLCT